MEVSRGLLGFLLSLGRILRDLLREHGEEPFPDLRDRLREHVPEGGLLGLEMAPHHVPEGGLLGFVLRRTKPNRARSQLCQHPPKPNLRDLEIRRSLRFCPAQEKT